MSEWQPIEEEASHERILLATDIKEEAVVNAKLKELSSWEKNNVYVIVKDDGQPTISTRWVLTNKLIENHKTIKARLVLRGFEEEDIQKMQKDSPTFSKECLRIVLAVLSTSNWKCNSLDVKTAFLQGHKIERNIFVKPPKEAETENVLWKLNKVVYGLVDAARAWYLRVKEELINLGMKMSLYDEALFYWLNNGKCEGLTIVHVDDFLWGGSQNFHNEVMTKVRNIFTIGSENPRISTMLVSASINVMIELNMTRKTISLQLRKWFYMDV